MSDPTGLPLVARPAANCLRVDHATVEVVTALRGASIRPILLKGPAIVAWLYPTEPERRPYVDADLLVSPSQFDQAEAVLTDLGFACESPISLRLAGDQPPHAEAWLRRADGAVVDLHACIHGTEHVDRDVAWSTLTATTGTIDLLGTQVETLAPPALALHAVLHRRPWDTATSQAAADLDRALVVTPPEVWLAAADLASELDVRAHMGAMLRCSTEGAALADRLDLPREWPLRLRLEADRAPHAALFAARVRDLPPGERLRAVWGKAFPPVDYVRRSRPIARHGTAGLLAAYAWRLLIIPVRAWQVRRADPRRRSD